MWGSGLPVRVVIEDHNHNGALTCELLVGPCRSRAAPEGRTKGLRGCFGASFGAVVVCTN